MLKEIECKCGTKFWSKVLKTRTDSGEKIILPLRNQCRRCENRMRMRKQMMRNYQREVKKVKQEGKKEKTLEITKKTKIKEVSKEDWEKARREYIKRKTRAGVP